MLLVGTQTIETTALINSGTTGNFIDLGLLSLANFPLKKLPQPIGMFNVDGTPNWQEMIIWKAHTHMVLSHGSNDLDLMVVSLGRKQVILGMPWLKSKNPHIDWKSNTLSFPRSCSPNNNNNLISQQYLLQWLGCDSDMELSSLFSQQYSSEDDASIHEYLPQKDLYCEHLNKITLSTELAQAAKTPDQKIPDWCSDLEDVFSEKTHNVLPPHRPYDHTIDLKPFFVPKIAKVYPLKPKEQEACKAFIDEHLKTGRIVPSKSPQAAPFFLSLRKTAPFALVRTIVTWTPIPSAMPTPYPLSLNWSMTWKTLQSLWSLMSDGDSTTFASKKKTNQKGHSLLPLGSLSWLSCSLDFATDHPLFSPLWTISSPTWLPNAGWRYIWMT